MRSTLMVSSLLICLLAVALSSGCLFGKGDDDAENAATGGPGGKMMGPGGAGKAEAPAPAGLAGPGAPGASPVGGPPSPPTPAAAKGEAEAPPEPAADPGTMLSQAKYAKSAAEYDRALDLLRKVTGQEPDNADAQWWMAWILAEQGKKAEATTAFNAFLAIEAEGARAKEAKAALERLSVSPAEASEPPGGMKGGPPGAGPGAGPGMPGPPPGGPGAK